MGCIMILFLAIFWTGVVLLVLSGLGFISISLWTILIVWLIILGLFISFIMISLKKVDEYMNEREAFNSMERAGAEKIKEMRENEKF